MKDFIKGLVVVKITGLLVVSAFTGCGGKSNFLGAGKKLMIEVVDQKDINNPSNPENPESPGDTDGASQDVPSTGKNGIHSIFQGHLGVPISSYSIGAIDPDPTGHTLCTDYDGDGIPNSEEIVTNPYVADYPKIVSGITGKITMEIKVLDTSIAENHVETVELTEENDTMKNSMEDRNYKQLNTKTTPYVSRESFTISENNSSSYGTSTSDSIGFGASVKIAGGSSTTSQTRDAITGTDTEYKYGGNVNFNSSSSNSMNMSISDGLSRSTMSEKTVFPTIDHVDNLDRHGVAFTNDNIKTMSQNYRKNDSIKSSQVVGPNAGVVTAGLYIKNNSVNIPARVSNVLCTLSFRTPAGEFLSVKTFRLRNEDYSLFEQDIYGDESFGPYTVEITDINTYDMKKALANGYVPQIHVVSYDMRPVLNSNYNPGVENLKIVEETAKGRTAVIKIMGQDMRDISRVCAFDVNEQGNISPGISLKKALFNILKNRIGIEEQWVDADMTVQDANLRWKSGNAEHSFTPGINGNSWKKFETYVKKYTTFEKMPDGTLKEVEHSIETIKRIGNYVKYNPFDLEDNPAYNPNERLSLTELYKMKYWYILHNGQYYEGDINDPIWVGDRYEIIFFDVKDFNEHYKGFSYMPLYSYEKNNFNTRWNRLSNEGEFARALNLGKVIKGDVIKLEVDLTDSRSLFNRSFEGKEFGDYVNIDSINGEIWHNFNYSFDEGVPLAQGIPQEFRHDTWGGCNKISLRIDPSQNAHFYTASIWGTSEDESTARVVKITLEELQKNNSFIIINRHSCVYQNESIGIGQIDGGSYRVKVRAHGKVSNVPVTKLSSEGVSVITVFDPPTEILPDRITFTATGSLNSINVNINESNDIAKQAEYYRIMVYGPSNYGNGNDPSIAPLFKSMVGHVGNNYIEVKNYENFGTGLTSSEENLADPGVFIVKVYSVSKNTIINNNELLNSDTIATNGDENSVLVEYERYGDQKEFKYLAQQSIEQFNPRDVDLEVNFNDGSGWFRLELSHDDYGVDDRTIKCNYTTNFDQNKKRVNIFFTAPSGSGNPQNSVYNVFRGGMDEVDVYLRTVAKSDFRDTLWLKPNSSAVFRPEESHFVNVNAEINTLPGYDVYRYWLENEKTDATHIEDYNTFGSRIFKNYSELNVSEGDFGVVCKNGKRDFFFSPAKNLVYGIRATITETDIVGMMDVVNHVDNPAFRAVAGDRSILVTNLDSQYATSFKVYWKQGALNSISENMNTYPWTSQIVQVSDTNSHSIKIDQIYNESGTLVPLIPYTQYTICVTAHNSNSNSSRVFKQVKTITHVETYELIEPKSLYHGYGSFGDSLKPLTNNYGNILINGLDFVYGDPLFGGLHNIFDTGTGGVFGSGKYMRIVNKQKNITDPTGLALTPVAMNLENYMSPPAGYCYIDPLRGEFVLPRPSYWSKLESMSNIVNAEVIEETPVTETTGSINSDGIASSVKFWKGLHRRAYRSGCVNSGQDYGSRYIYPNGKNNKDWTKGTISAYVKVSTSSTTDLGVYGRGIAVIGLIGDESTFRVVLTSDHENQVPLGTAVGINIAGSVVTADVIESGTLYHIYIVWDIDKGLQGGKSVRVFLNGIERVSTTNDLPPILSSYSLMVSQLNYAYGNALLALCASGTSETYLDNLKVWNHVVSEDPSWEYNSDVGREDALHVIYGEDSGYRPSLTGNGNGVGFYSIPAN